MTASSPAEPSISGFRPLAPLLKTIQSERLDAARLRVAEIERDELMDRFRSAFENGKRLVALLTADELTARGIPPTFRHLHLSGAEYSVDQRFDLLIFDLRWIRRWYPDHAKIVRYRRCKALLIGSESLFHREAEYAFYQGKRPTWKIVSSLSLTQQQQADCYLLRSAPIKKRNEATQAMRDRVFEALQDDLRTVRRTKSFTNDHAEATLARRHALWLCSRMTDGSPTETAVRYTQLTGHQITRQAVAKQLEKVREILKKAEMTF